MNILVSVCCITYNHEDFIADALESFLMQKTEFPFEILIHDDASTDRTAEIIKEYASKYPEVIKPVYQTENQYSKGVKVGHLNRERAQGKYIAACEGDDYWTDPYKLQKQVNYMEKHPECSLCFHKVKMVRSDNGRTVGYLGADNGNRAVPIEDMIAWTGFSQVSSMVYRKQYMENPPDFYLQAPVGDVFMVLNLAIRGTLYYFDEVMSAYRTEVSGSWTNRISGSRDQKIKFLKGMLNKLNEFNSYTDYKYSDSVELQLAKSEISLLIAEGNVQAVKQAQYRRYNKKLSIYDVARIYMNKYFPALYDKLRQYKARRG